MRSPGPRRAPWLGPAGVTPERLVFTAGGTESNNLALHAALTARPERRHLIVTAVEHASVLEPALAWARHGIRLTVLPVSSDGALDLAALEESLDDTTALVSVMAANNETGVCFPLESVRAMAQRVGAWLHTDAVQVAGKQEPPSADLVTLCAHKLHGPKGAGALVVPAGLRAHPLLAGGEQEAGWRAGTENVAALAGFGAAAEAAAALPGSLRMDWASRREAMERAVLARIPESWVIGAGQPRLPNTSLFCFAGVDTEALLARLDLAGFCCSSGSACAAGAHEPSHVLKAMGWVGRGAVVRVSTSRLNAPADTESLVDALVLGVHQLRQVTRS